MNAMRAGRRTWCGAATMLLALAITVAAAASPDKLRAGDYTINYNALSGDQLPLASTQAYGLRHASDQGLVIIAVNAHHGSTRSNVPLTVAGHATTLLGDRIPLKVRYIHDDPGSYSALVTFTVSAHQTVRFELDVTPRNGPTTQLDFVHSFVP